MYKTLSGTTIHMDIDETGGTPDLKELCILSLDETLGEILDTWRTNCRSGKSTSALIGLEEEVNFVIKFNTSNEADVYLYSIRKDILKRNDRSFVIIDGMNGASYSMKGVISEISHTKEMETVTELNIAFKINEEVMTPAKVQE